MIEKLIEENHTQLVNVLRTLTYRENKNIISKIDFNEDRIFLEPLLFAYFNRIQTDTVFSESLLSELMQSHFIEKEPLQLKGSYNQNDVAYIPNLGYYRKEKEKVVNEELQYVEGTNIEILKYDIPLLRNVLEVITSRTPGEKHFFIKDQYVEENLSTLNQAFKQIKNAIPSRYVFIEKCCKKILLFNEPNPKVPSRVTINALGTLFINIYNNEKNLPFFIDTIAQLTGSMIMTTILQDKKSIFKVDHTQKISPITQKEDRRNIYTLFHRLYCHYAAFHCLHHYIGKEFCKEEDRMDLTRRMVFYLKKCKNDLENFEMVAAHFTGIENILTENGIYLFNIIENSYKEVLNDRNLEMKKFEHTPINYRMGYSEFIRIKE